MKRILDHQEAEDGTLEFRIEWDGKWKPTWEPSSHIPEESIITATSCACVLVCTPVTVAHAQQQVTISPT